MGIARVLDGISTEAVDILIQEVDGVKTRRRQIRVRASRGGEREEILSSLKELGKRIALIEGYLGIGGEASRPRSLVQDPTEGAEETLERQIGQNWFARAGIVVLALGMMFLLTFPYANLPAWVPSFIGYFLVVCILWLSKTLRKGYSLVSRYLQGAGLVLLYFTTLRLAHFSPAPVLASTPVEVVLLLAVVAVNLVVAVRRRSISLAGLALALGILTALAVGGSYVVPVVITVTSLAAVVLRLSRSWAILSIMGIVFANTAHGLWVSGNSLFATHAVPTEINLLFVLAYAGMFAVGNLYRRDHGTEDAIVIATETLNGLVSYSLLFMLTFVAFPEHMVFWHVLASALFLALAVLFWIRQKSRYATFVYAMLGYGALSVAIVARFPRPDFFVWLCWQSLLVLSTAVWFRSRFIVVANFTIFAVIFLTYLFIPGTVSAVSISFGIVALLSARILNWRKERLELRTEAMRNAYLAGALFVIPYALYNVVPAGLVSLSWVAVAAGYYVVSRWLHLRKYRWMALLTMSMTVVYVFLVDLTGVNPALRIVSFLVLGSALLAISMTYSRKKQTVAHHVRVAGRHA